MQSIKLFVLLLCCILFCLTLPKLCLIPSLVGIKILGSLSYDNHNSGENV